MSPSELLAAATNLDNLARQLRQMAETMKPAPKGAKPARPSAG